MLHRSLAFLPLVLLLSSLSVGCGGDVSDAPKTVPVSGIITLDGNPLAGANVLYVPTDPKVNAFSGTTNAEGKYSLSQGLNKGAVPGSYKVVVEHFVKADGATVPAELSADLEQMKMAGLAKPSLPDKYMNYASTDLTATVEAAKADGYDFKLTSN